MKKIIGSAVVFCFVLMACNDTDETTETTVSSNTSTDATSTTASGTTSVVTDEKS